MALQEDLEVRQRRTAEPALQVEREERDRHERRSLVRARGLGRPRAAGRAERDTVRRAWDDGELRGDYIQRGAHSQREQRIRGERGLFRDDLARRNVDREEFQVRQRDGVSRM